MASESPKPGTTFHPKESITVTQFALTNAVAKVSSFNPRAEKHGEDNVPAGDIKFEVTTHSSALDSFSPTFRKFLFCKPRVGEQPGLPFAEGDDLTSLAQPKLKPQRLTEEFTGYGLTIGSGLDSVEPLHLHDVKLSNFVFEPLNGGSVVISFNATCHPDAEVSGELCQMIQDSVEITLTPPKQAQNDLADAA